jgi:hypothetical protein
MNAVHTVLDSLHGLQGNIQQILNEIDQYYSDDYSGSPVNVDDSLYEELGFVEESGVGRRPRRGKRSRRNIGSPLSFQVTGLY